MRPEPAISFSFVLPQDPQGGAQPDRPIAPAENQGQAVVQDPAGGTGGTGPGAPADACGGGNTFLWMGLFLALMWLLVFRPANKQRKQHQQMIQAIKKGDHVVTTGGMHGVIANMGDKTITLRVDSIQVVIDRSAIGRVERNDKDAKG